MSARYSDRCTHRHITVDVAADVEVCCDCGIVFQERPSLDGSSTMTDSWVVSLPKATRDRVLQFATRLGVSVDQYMHACRCVEGTGVSARHPATLAAYILESPGVDIPVRDAARVLDIPIRFLSRAVSRVRAMNVQK